MYCIRHVWSKKISWKKGNRWWATMVYVHSTGPWLMFSTVNSEKRGNLLIAAALGHHLWACILTKWDICWYSLRMTDTFRSVNAFFLGQSGKRGQCLPAEGYALRNFKHCISGCEKYWKLPRNDRPWNRTRSQIVTSRLFTNRVFVPCMHTAPCF